MRYVPAFALAADPAPVLPAASEVLWWNVLTVAAVVALAFWLVSVGMNARRTAKQAKAEVLDRRAQLNDPFPPALP